jgi:hypothetical protein
VVPLKSGTNKINAACHPQACFFQFFIQNWPNGRTIKVGVAAKLVVK